MAFRPSCHSFEKRSRLSCTERIQKLYYKFCTFFNIPVIKKLIYFEIDVIMTFKSKSNSPFLYA